MEATAEPSTSHPPVQCNKKGAKADDLHLSEMRIILLGCKGSGKSSSANTILGRGDFRLERAAQFEKRQGDVAGRQVTVVDTPGWWMDYPLKYTSELIKQEIVLSASRCPPGPHGLLLVIRVGTTYNAVCKSAEEHMELLGEIVWSHTIILFTCGDSLGDTLIEQYIEREGNALQRLVEKCGNRYHVFNNKNRGDDTQVTELLGKIEEMVAGDKQSCFEIDRRVLEETEKKRRTQDERATQRQIKKERESIRSMMGDDLHLSEMRIILLGRNYSGKSSSGNTILGREDFRSEQRRDSEKRQGDVAGRQVTVVNTPGWSRNYPLKDTSELIKQEILLSACLCPPGPHGLLLVIDVDTSYNAVVSKSVEEHMQLLGERVWSHTILLFTFGDSLGYKSIQHYIESEGEALERLVEKCGNRYHVFNNKITGDDTQVTQLLDKIEEMVARNGGGHYETVLSPAPSVFVDKHCGFLIENVTMVDPILDLLHNECVITQEVCNYVRSKPNAMEMMMELYTFLHDNESKDIFYRGLEENEPFLLKILRETTGDSGASGNKLNKKPSGKLDSRAAGFGVWSDWLDLNDLWSDVTLEWVGPDSDAVNASEETSFSPTEQATNEYRFKFSGAGLFQCSQTGLGFTTTGEGDVLHRIVQWDERQVQPTGKTPAGPLYSIQCPQDTICQLHLPHCDIRPGDLSVAHITDEGLHLLEPQEVTQTHVIVNVTHLSFYGILKRIENYMYPTCGQVLLFLRPPGEGKQILSVFLLPGNLPIEEVQVKHKKDEHIDTTSDCINLTPNHGYSLQCTSYKVQPETATYRLNYGPNYHPTFQVKIILKAKEFTLELLGPEKDVVWKQDIDLEALPKGATASVPAQPQGAAASALTCLTASETHFVDQHRVSLVNRVMMVDSILDLLLSERCITQEGYDKVSSKTTTMNMMRELYKLLDSSGSKAKDIFYKGLEKNEPLLLEDLMSDQETPPPQHPSTSHPLHS